MRLKRKDRTLFFVGAWMVGVECEVRACACWLTEDFEVEGSVRLSADECVHEW